MLAYTALLSRPGGSQSTTLSDNLCEADSELIKWVRSGNTSLRGDIQQIMDANSDNALTSVPSFPNLVLNPLAVRSLLADKDDCA